ncbi:LipA and NB-ARC domain-containing protein [Pleurostoma richardsiae]|uniref:LipA and NB-ARC domain-containing protein n=1 Tax=Pleurostoma richardsiae TaxID=41990 RepID=A0AA38S0T9_9PEZI|nr:LipA and NB-ARC domain-containing protein [Pleurostoma richardsiae]
MGSVNKQIARYECTAVYTHPNAKSDIVLVHGLNGDPQRTWTAQNGVFWPADLLPDSLKDAHANVLVYGYNGDVYSTRNDRSASDNYIHHHAQTLVTTLTLYRKSEESTRKPIIWVCHSLGGILVKRALEYSNDLRASHHEEYRSVYVSTYGIVFLGTPHTGSGLATWGRVLQTMSDIVVPKKLFESEPVLLKTLKRDNETLQNINSHFLDIYQRFKIHVAHENVKTDIKGSRVLVVDPTSASPQLPGVTYYGIEANHSGMCKFESREAPGYRTVSTALRDWVREAPAVIQVRWVVEEEDRLARAMQEVDERMRPFMKSSAGTSQPTTRVERSNDITASAVQQDSLSAPSPVPLLTLPSSNHDPHNQPSAETQNEPLFVHPEPFRPNSFFVGRQGELQDLHKMLMDGQRRAEGTSAVLIQCLPGGGKTHLARQYAFQHMSDYPGGVYWVTAKSLHEMEYGYWRIAKTEAMRGLSEQDGIDHATDSEMLVEGVRRWLNGFDEWLLILDGILFDTPGVQRFIPDAKNTSLIYTSTQRAVTGDHHFDNPQIMELTLLGPQEAQELLLLEMEKRRPWTQDDRSRAYELVQLMGRLPLMIHVTAQHLKATREPLAKYLNSYRNRPKVGSLPAYNAVWDQLQRRGAVAALNLMSILVFFDQHVPVEMVSLGLGALDKRTPYKTCDASHRKATLTNTLKVLIAFALVERTEAVDISPTSSRSSKRSLDRTVDTLDLLMIHSVVQTFFIESLAGEKQHYFWLERASAVFCRSFDEAKRRMNEDPVIGLPDDYRRFTIHGRKLVEHLDRFEKKCPELLSAAKTGMEDRLGQIQLAVHQLSQTHQAGSVEEYNHAPRLSVFERNNSLTETDSEPPSHHSISEEDRWTKEQDDRNIFHQSPSTYAAQDFNPYHWHIPYPHRDIIPGEPYPADEDDKTGISTPKPAQVEHMASRAQSADVDRNHRVVKRNEGRVSLE